MQPIPPKADPANTTALVNSSNAHLLLGKFADAVSDSERALKLDAHCTKAYLNRAIAQKRLGKIPESLKEFELRPDNAAAFGTRALVNYCFDRFDEAKSDVASALSMTPLDAESFYIRAFIHERMGEIELAKQDYAKAAELGFKLPSFTTLSLHSALYDEALNHIHTAATVDSSN